MGRRTPDLFEEMGGLIRLLPEPYRSVVGFVTMLVILGVGAKFAATVARFGGHTPPWPLSWF